jgi:hypothetical protein
MGDKIDTIGVEARKQAGLMPMHPAILRRRRARRWRRLALWFGLCGVGGVCAEMGLLDMLGLSAPPGLRLCVYGVLVVPVLVLNVWFLPRDRKRERLFAQQWANASEARVRDVIEFGVAQTQQEQSLLDMKYEHGRKLLLGGVMTLIAAGLTTWLLYDKFTPKGRIELWTLVAFISGIVALMTMWAPWMRYTIARGSLRMLNKERAELKSIARHLPDVASAGDLSEARDVGERGALSIQTRDTMS